MVVVVTQNFYQIHMKIKIECEMITMVFITAREHTLSFQITWQLVCDFLKMLVKFKKINVVAIERAFFFVR